jgi:hypothetical protein
LELIRSRRIQGFPTQVKWVWAAMNPVTYSAAQTLDEALITWDKERLTAGLDLLAQIARKRQILIFTCHDFIVDTMRENQPTAQIIELKA